MTAILSRPQCVKIWKMVVANIYFRANTTPYVLVITTYMSICTRYKLSQMRRHRMLGFILEGTVSITKSQHHSGWWCGDIRIQCIYNRVIDPIPWNIQTSTQDLWKLLTMWYMHLIPLTKYDACGIVSILLMEIPILVRQHHNTERAPSISERAIPQRHI